MARCKYEYHDVYTNYKCVEETWKDSDYCILHTDFPDDEKSPEFKLISEEKKKKTKAKISNNDFDFTGAKLRDIRLQGADIKGRVIFSHAIIEVNADFSDATIRYAYFIGTTFHGIVNFRRAKIMEANFSNANLKYDATSSDNFDETLEADASSSYDIMDAFMDESQAGFSYAIMDESHFNFTDTIIHSAQFDGITTNGFVNFSGAKIRGYANFSHSNLKCGIEFRSAIIEYDANFDGSNLEGHSSFQGAIIRGNAEFEGTSINVADFKGAIIEGNANFIDSIINSCDIEMSDIKGRLLLKGSKFKLLQNEEVAYRKAKRIYESLGDKKAADEHYYLEMITHRKQKPYYYRYPELLVQYCFGYGVYPIRIIGTAIAIAIIFAIIFWRGSALQGADTFPAYLYFSFKNALALGSSDYLLISGKYQILATLEVTLGTFLWAAFIATFARKYMR